MVLKHILRFRQGKRLKNRGKQVLLKSGIQNEPHNSKVNHAAFALYRLMKDYHIEEYPFWKRLRVRM